MDAAVRALVWKRAAHRCEYCQLHQLDADFFSFHVEHIVAKQHFGSDDADNLCLACAECNLAKGPNLSGRIGNRIYPLFDPRKQKWKRHFHWDHTILVGKTLTGRVTVQVLNMNAPARVMLRENLFFEGRFPPD